MTDASWKWIVESGEPDEPGWYAVVMCWDAAEGMFPDASKWTGSKWDELTRGIAALAKLMRSKSGPAQDAARMVLCDKMRPADAARATGAAPASASNSVTRMRAALELARVASSS